MTPAAWLGRFSTMAATDVVLRDEMGLRIPSISRVPVTEGSQVTFTAGDDVASALFFSPETALILSPRPDARVDIAAGGSVTYTFASAGAGAYGVVTQAPEDQPPAGFDFGAPSTPPDLVVQPGPGLDFPAGGGGSGKGLGG